MVDNVLQQVEDLVSVNINVALIVVLMFIGLFLKHAIKKLDNSWIPLILGILGMIISVLMKIPFNPQTDLLTILVEGIVAAVFATIFQTKLKDILAAMKNAGTSIGGPGDTSDDQASEVCILNKFDHNYITFP